MSRSRGDAAMAAEGLGWELLPASRESAEGHGHGKELEGEGSREEYHGSRAATGKKKCPRERVAERAANREKRREKKTWASRFFLHVRWQIKIPSG
jgi:hypothetical protein